MINLVHTHINSAIFYWDNYLIYGKLESLHLAHASMKKYRELGGEDYKETETHILAHIESNQIFI